MKYRLVGCLQVLYLYEVPSYPRTLPPQICTEVHIHAHNSHNLHYLHNPLVKPCWQHLITLSMPSFHSFSKWPKATDNKEEQLFLLKLPQASMESINRKHFFLKLSGASCLTGRLVS